MIDVALKRPNMKQFGNIIISDSVWEARFACNLSKCKGKCCQHGDLGAVITDTEESIIEASLDKVAPLLTKRNLNILKQGVSEDFRGNKHIVEGGTDTPCPLSFISEEGIIYCSLHRYAMEQNEHILDYKPLWCTLFPLIIRQVSTGWLINCFFNDFCVSVDNPPPLLLAFEDTLTHLFGEAWMSAVKAEYKKEGQGQ